MNALSLSKYSLTSRRRSENSLLTSDVCWLLRECSHGACTELRVAVERIGPAVQRKKAASALSALLDRVAVFQRCAYLLRCCHRASVWISRMISYDYSILFMV